MWPLLVWDYSPNDSDSPCCCRPLVEEYTVLRDLVGLLVGLGTILARLALPLWSWWESPWVGSCGVCRRCHCQGRDEKDHKVAASIRCGWCRTFFGSGLVVAVSGSDPLFHDFQAQFHHPSDTKMSMIESRSVDMGYGCLFTMKAFQHQRLRLLCVGIQLPLEEEPTLTVVGWR